MADAGAIVVARSAAQFPNVTPIPYWCASCHSCFGVWTGAGLERSRVPLREWVVAIIQCRPPMGATSACQSISVVQ